MGLLFLFSDNNKQHLQPPSHLKVIPETCVNHVQWNHITHF